MENIHVKIVKFNLQSDLMPHVNNSGCPFLYGNIQYSAGGIAPNQVIVRSEFEVHREIYTE